MAAEDIVYAALADLASGNVWPDVAPEDTGRPFITFSAAGGTSYSYLSGDTPSLFNTRMQVSVWADSRPDAVALMRTVFARLVNPSVQAVAIGAPVSTREQETKLFGSSLDFSITYKDITE